VGLLLRSTGTNGSFTSFYLRPDNQQGAGGVVGNCPFVVGQDVVLADIDDSANVVCAGTGTTQTKITSIVYDSAKSPPMLKVTVNASMFNKTAGEILINDAILAQDPRTDTYKPTYTISDTELIVQQVQMPDGFKSRMIGMLKEGGTLNYDFLSATNYKFSQLAGDTVANIRLPVNESRAKAIFMIPTDATQYKPETSMNGSGTYFIEPAGAVDGAMADIDINSTRSGLVGIADYIRDYQILYDGKLNPTRPVPCGKISDRTSIEQQPLIELEKALAMGGIHPLSFAKFRENFCIGRALSLQDGVVDLRGKDFSLQVQYDLPEEGDPAAKNKLWMSWVSHLRRIVVRGDAISLEI
tara:strand:+ start:645 stop:1709 length:1065 start_codon:yes stop_codon:yes gene_type:complete